MQLDGWIATLSIYSTVVLSIDAQHRSADWLTDHATSYHGLNEWMNEWMHVQWAAAIPSKRSNYWSSLERLSTKTGRRAGRTSCMAGSWIDSWTSSCRRQSSLFQLHRVKAAVNWHSAAILIISEPNPNPKTNVNPNTDPTNPTNTVAYWLTATLMFIGAECGRCGVIYHRFILFY